MKTRIEEGLGYSNEQENISIPGDGIGQEVTASAIQILDFIIKKFSLNFSIELLDVGGTAYEKFGSPIPENVLKLPKKQMLFIWSCRSSAVGWS